MKYWFKIATVVFLAGCSSPIHTETTATTPVVVVDFGNVVTDPMEDLLPPPSLKDLVLPESSKVKEPLELQLERLEDYNDYIERSINGLEGLLNKGKGERDLAREALGDMVFDCSKPVFPQIKLDPEPSAKLEIEGLDDRQLAEAAVRLAEKLKEHNEKNLRRISEGVAKYTAHCK